MSTLVVYHDENLLNPVKLLTHEQDIAAVLDSAGLTFAVTELPAGSTEQSIGELSDWLHVQLQRHLPLTDFTHAEILRFASLPGYAVVNPADGGPEHSHEEDGVRLFVEGGGNLCVHLNAYLYVLSCVPGTLISLPAGTPHWFRQRTGGPCAVIRVAPSQRGLVPAPTGSDIAARMELPEL